MSLYPFSLSNKNASRKPGEKSNFYNLNTVSPVTDHYSIEISDEDKEMQSVLRSNSFTGETTHPMLRQLSRGRVAIPVEHAEEIEDGDVIFRTSEPELAKPNNDNRKKDASNWGFEPFKPLDENEKNKLKNLQNTSGPLSYDPHKYEAQWSMNKDSSLISSPTFLREASHVDVNKRFEEGIQKLSIEETTRKTEERKSENRDVIKEAQKQHDLEIKKQDKYMKENYTLQRFHIIPDGNCLYRAVAQSVLQDQSQHMMLRQLALDHIKEHKDEFKNIIEGNPDEFLAAAEQEGEWAGYPEILALSRLLEINVNITTGGTLSNPNVCLRLHHFDFPDADSANSPGKKTADCTQRQSIWLSWLSNGHYDAFVTGHMENPEYRKWLRLKESRTESDAALASQLHKDEARELYQCQKAPRYNDFNSSSKENGSSIRCTEPSNQNPPLVTNFNRDLYPESSSTHGFPTNINRDPYVFTDDSQLVTSTHGHAAGTAPASHEYPAATWGRSALPKQPPCSVTTETSTNLDADLAMALQREEIEERDRSYPYIGGYFGGYYA